MDVSGWLIGPNTCWQFDRLKTETMGSSNPGNQKEPTGYTGTQCVMLGLLVIDGTALRRTSEKRKHSELDDGCRALTLNRSKEDGFVIGADTTDGRIEIFDFGPH